MSPWTIKWVEKMFKILHIKTTAKNGHYAWTLRDVYMIKLKNESRLHV